MRKRLLVLWIPLVLLAGCGLNNDIVTTLITGGLDDNGNMPAEICTIEERVEIRSSMGENLRLIWKLVLGEATADDEYFTLSQLYEQSEVELLDGNTAIATGTAPLSDNEQDQILWLDSPGLTAGTSYSWRVRLTGDPEDENFHSAWYSPYELIQRETVKLEEEIIGSGEYYYDYYDGIQAEIFNGSNGIMAAYLKGNETVRIRFKADGGSWIEAGTLDLSNSSSNYRKSDRIEIDQDDSGRYHIMAALEGRLYYSTWSQGDMALAEELFDTESYLDISQFSRPSMALDSDGNVNFLYTDNLGNLFHWSVADGSETDLGMDIGGDDTYAINRSDIDFFCDDSGTLQAVYFNESANSLEHIVYNGTAWDNPITIDNGDLHDQFNAAPGPNGSVFLVFTGIVDVNNPQTNPLYYAEFNGTVWSDPELISNNLWNQSQYESDTNSVKICIDSNGNPYIMAMMSAYDDVVSDSPAPMISLWKKPADTWLKHNFQLGTGIENINEDWDLIQADFQIDSAGVLHILFRENTYIESPDTYTNDWEGTSIFVKYASIGLADLDFY